MPIGSHFFPRASVCRALLQDDKRRSVGRQSIVDVGIKVLLKDALEALTKTRVRLIEDQKITEMIKQVLMPFFTYQAIFHAYLQHLLVCGLPVKDG